MVNENNNIVIKIASEKDISLILQFIKDLANYEKLLNEVVATEESLKETLFGETSYAKVLLAYYENNPCGFALYFYNYSTFLSLPGIYLEDLYISPEYRNKGIGKKLLKYIANIAVSNNFGRLEWSVLDWNKPAINFYNKIGAKPKHKWITYQLSGPNLFKLAKE
ncbi:MAG: GNAT family N-acetyltransferase [Cyanobacteriota bacterium]